MAYHPRVSLGPIKGGASIAQTTFTTVRGLVVGGSGAAWNEAAYPTLYGASVEEGTQFEVDAWGVFSTTGTPTVILGLYLGPINDPVTTSPAILAVSTAKTMTTGATSWAWEAHYYGRIVEHGTTGSIIGHGNWRFGTSLTAWTEVRWPETTPAAVAADTTVNKGLAIGWTWSASSASNSVTCHYMAVNVAP